MGTFRRATGQRINHFDRMTKGLFVSLLAEHGWTLDAERQHAGEWNDSKVWFAVSPDGDRYDLDRQMKGDRADWEGMARELQSARPDAWPSGSLA